MRLDKKETLQDGLIMADDGTCLYTPYDGKKQESEKFIIEACSQTHTALINASKELDDKYLKALLILLVLNFFNCANNSFEGKKNNNELSNYSVNMTHLQTRYKFLDEHAFRGLNQEKLQTVFEAAYRVQQGAHLEEFPYSRHLEDLACLLTKSKFGKKAIAHHWLRVIQYAHVDCPGIDSCYG